MLTSSSCADIVDGDIKERGERVGVYLSPHLSQQSSQHLKWQQLHRHNGIVELE